MKFVFIVNPKAGNENQKKLLSWIKSNFRLIDDEMIIEETHKSGDAKNISKRYAKDYGDGCIVVSCGGDGTIHEIVNGLCGTDTPLMVLPFGRGNDFAKKVYNDKKIDVNKVIDAFGLMDGEIQYQVKPIDLIDYNGEKCVNVMSFGLDTKVVAYAGKISNAVPFISHSSYNVAVVPVIAQPLHYKISYDITCVDENGDEYQMVDNNKDYALFAICNASYYGGGYCPAPNSILDDGLLDFAMIDGTSLAKALPLIPKYSAGKLTEENGNGIVHTGYMKEGRIWMEDGSKLLGNCDGELLDCNEVNFKVLPKALKLCFLKDIDND